MSVIVLTQVEVQEDGYINQFICLAGKVKEHLHHDATGGAPQLRKCSLHTEYAKQ